jgi:hypothetical protein
MHDDDDNNDRVVNFALVQAIKVQRGSRDIALVFL